MFIYIYIIQIKYRCKWTWETIKLHTRTTIQIKYRCKWTWETIKHHTHTTIQIKYRCKWTWETIKLLHLYFIWIVVWVWCLIVSHVHLHLYFIWIVVRVWCLIQHWVIVWWMLDWYLLFVASESFSFFFSTLIMWKMWLPVYLEFLVFIVTFSNCSAVSWLSDLSGEMSIRNCPIQSLS
jgi:hypothetical protein